MKNRISTLPRIAILALAAALPVSGSLAATDCESPERLSQVVAAEHRSADNRARDAYRRPLQTLQWLGVKAEMTVVEIWPGAGWYSEILAPYLKGCGVYYAAAFDPMSKIPFYRINAERLKAKFDQHPEYYAEARITVLQPPARLNIAPEGSADRVLTFRNVHNWMKAGNADQVFEAMFRALKPGGVLGVVEHRAAIGSKQDPEALSGYVSEAYVKQLAAQAGFQFLDRSELNANPRDSRDHPKGVWTLPPSLRLGDVDQEKYLAIGESDRMTLKFIKPLTAGN